VVVEDFNIDSLEKIINNIKEKRIIWKRNNRLIKINNLEKKNMKKKMMKKKLNITHQNNNNKNWKKNMDALIIHQNFKKNKNNKHRKNKIYKKKIRK